MGTSSSLYLFLELFYPRECCEYIYFPHSEANVECDWRLWQLLLRVWTQRGSCCDIYTDESGSNLAFVIASERRCYRLYLIGVTCPWEVYLFPVLFRLVISLMIMIGSINLTWKRLDTG